METKAVQVVGVTDPIAMGNQAMALLGIRADADPRAIADVLSRQEEVIYVVLTAGPYGLFAEVVCASPPDLLDFINDVVRDIDGVIGVDAFPYFGIHTHRFLWGVG
ncbi:Lrp/AsnC family transcriptional regulator [Streptosporangium sp. NPDC000396]|uniref:Lrp/AsnC family transcriptional regulator n=1 Tax=Streptosporangium sp. NPDC000396 TaxID=3366185 RepID=UPI00368436EA